MNDMTPMLKTEVQSSAKQKRARRSGAAAALGHAALLSGLGVVALLASGLALFAWRYQQQQHDIAATEQRLNMVPKVRTAAVKASPSAMAVTLPATTSAFTTANIFARASGYIKKRNVHIGDRVKAAELLARSRRQSSITRSRKPKPRSRRA